MRTPLSMVTTLACILSFPGNIANAEYLDGMNLYEYVNSQPTSAADPSGLIADAIGGNLHHWIPLWISGIARGSAQDTGVLVYLTFEFHKKLNAAEASLRATNPSHLRALLGMAAIYGRNAPRMIGSMGTMWARQVAAKGVRGYFPVRLRAFGRASAPAGGYALVIGLLAIEAELVAEKIKRDIQNDRAQIRNMWHTLNVRTARQTGRLEATELFFRAPGKPYRVCCNGHVLDVTKPPCFVQFRQRMGNRFGLAASLAMDGKADQFDLQEGIKDLLVKLNKCMKRVCGSEYRPLNRTR